MSWYDSRKHPIERCMGTKIGMFKIFSKITETLTESTASQWNSSSIFSQDTIRCSSAKKSKVYCADWEKHQKFSQEESYSCRCSTTFLVNQKTMKKNAWQMPKSFFRMQRDLEKDNGHSLVLVLKRSGTLSKKTIRKEYGTIWPKGCDWNSQKVDCPEVDSKAKDMVDCRFTMQPPRKRLRLFFA